MTMPELTVNGARIHYEEVGSGPETLVFSHGLLMSGEMFREQVAAFKDRYRCITFDHRGQGKSEVTPGGYDMDSLTEDAAVLIRELDAAPCHFAGLSMGGFVGMRLAVRYPELLQSLILMETTADPEPEENKGPYRRLAFVGRWFGFRIVAKKVMKIMFGPSFLNDPRRTSLRKQCEDKLIALDKVGTNRAAHGVIDRNGFYEHLADIDLPTLILVGDEDGATPLPKSERMHAAIRNSRLEVIPHAGHSASIEEPRAVNEAIGDFLSELANDP
jgi:pimeloyl-ACP methyl ester carboxylesterase